MLYGIYELSGSGGLNLANKYSGNEFYGITTPIVRNSANKVVQRDNYTNYTIATGGLSILERAPYACGNVSGAVSFDKLNGAVQTATITGNITAVTLAAGDYVGQLLERRFLGGSGGYTYAKATNEKLQGGVFTPSATVGAQDTLFQEWDGTYWVEKQRIMGVA